MDLVQKRAFARLNGLTDAEFDLACEIVGREPTQAEVGIFSAMWSEHCSYKSSRVHLGRLPTQGEFVVQGPGENAGAVDIGAGLAAVFKMESHNHPSFIEPYHGAATGVGGILRDVFTMGARPVASLNSLRFGALDHPKTPHLFEGVTGGIAGYGNGAGVPTVGGEVYFDPSYNGNILVNAFNVGVCRKDAIFKGVARGVGNPVFYVGRPTGRDGIQGAAMASQEFAQDAERPKTRIPTGDPIAARALMEGCLELMQTDAVVGIQDMGAAGLTSSSVEMAERAGNGVRILVDDIPASEEGMTAYEFLLSETQERMLIVVERGKEATVAEIFARWELPWAQIGEVIAEDVFEVWQQGEKVVDIPVSRLTSSAPKYDRPQARPAYLAQLKPAAIPPPPSLEEAFKDLLESPNICSRQRVYEQFDQQAGQGVLVGAGSADAAVLQVADSTQLLAVAADCNSRFCYLDPMEGAKIAVAECARNLSCVGATPLGATDCLNFGNPENPEVMWQLARAIDGIRDACLALEVPVVSGNVSLYNASDEVDIFPTPTIGMVGGFGAPFQPQHGAPADAPRHMTMGFKAAGDAIILLGETDQDDLGGSEYLWRQTGTLGDRPPRIDLGREAALQGLVRELIARDWVHSAHDCADGGLGVALAECCFASSIEDIGVALEMQPGARPDLELFSESTARIVVSTPAAQVDRLLQLARQAGVVASVIGHTSASATFDWPGVLNAEVAALRARWARGLDSLRPASAQ